MKSSWRIGRVAGIDVHLHFTFLILLGWVALSHYLQRQNWRDALGGLAFTLSLFTIVVLHELGHALTARRFGIRTRDITLLPIGGVARLERIPENPKQELLVALAGPAVNVVLAALFLGVLMVGAELPAAKEFKLVGGHFLAKLMWINVSLAVFNLLPAFPMDGGRVLRAVLAMRMDYVRATNIAASIGKGMAWVFASVGLFTNPFLIFIALFVWIGAAQEASQAQMKSALAGLPVSRVMMTDFRTLAPDDTLARAVEHILAGCQQDFPV
ncbi:MAG TPA: site-2 protease family protein, partial [Candidatus Saccharimonadales bacterium]|nr:site-2 protease family protein [Candidatus Saccharimonadales bacterium]